MSNTIPEEHAAGSKDFNWSPYTLKEALAENEVSITSIYLQMRDGVKIAISYYLPVAMPDGEKRPVILHATRYWRALEMVPPAEDIRRYLANGYAWVSVDARGTGASFGYWSGPWGPEEVQDYDEVVNWIIQQPWSTGKVGTVGVSYDGTTAEMIVTNLNPAVKAAIPQFSLFDPLPDIAAPGGIFLADFLQSWADLNASLDRNELRTIPLGKNKNLQVGVLPVDEDKDRSILESAVSEHPYNFHAFYNVLTQRFRDDHWDTDPSRTISDYTPVGKIEELNRSGIPIYSYSGYGDGAYPLSAVHRFLTIKNPGSKLVLGPWSHGGHWNISPYIQAQSAFDHTAEEIRFFDKYLKDIETGIDKEPPVHYYTMVEEKWKAAESFPPQTQALTLYFKENNRLKDQPPAEEEAFDTYQVDYTTGTGKQTRWDTLLGGSIVTYSNRAEEDEKLLCYDSAPLEKDLILTGSPVITLFLAANTADANFFVYLEDVNPDGSVHHVTEGELKALHRKLSDDTPPYNHMIPYRTFLRKDALPLSPGEINELVFHLIPVSFMFRKGNCIRVALAGADKDQFMHHNAPPPLIKYLRQADYASNIRLPIENKKGK